MKKLPIFFTLSLTVIGLASAGELTPFHAGNGAYAPRFRDHDGCWAEPPDTYGGSAVSSMYLPFYPDTIDSEVANDLLFAEETEIVLARWWGMIW